MPAIHIPIAPRAAAVTAAAYLAASGSAVALTRFGGGAAFLWAANAVLLAALVNARRQAWPATVAACWAASVVAVGCWGLGWPAAPAISVVNVAEAVVGALLLRRWDVHRSGLDSAGNLARFVLAAGVIAPALTGLPGAFIIGRATGTGFPANLGHWYVAHALGALTFTPVFAQAASGELRRWIAASGARKLMEAAALLLLVAGVSTAVFAQGRFPLLFLPVLPLMLITFRVGRVGSASAVVVIAAVGVALTLDGRGPINLIRGGTGERLQFLQLYLAVTVMTVLPVAADLARRHRLFERLRDSEARFRLLTENSTDVVLNLGVDGTIRYASPSIERIGGYHPELLVGRAGADLVAPADRDRVRDTHRAALARPGETFCVEYRGVVPGGEDRWFETRTRAVLDERGAVQGVVSAVRETSDRRRAEAELARAAETDPLTGLSNRRAFDRELARHLSDPDGRGGCVAIFDLDHFKRINDGFGHAVGDEVLRAFARVARAKARGGDVLARLGGEEFGLICAGAEVDQARAACDRIREALSGHLVKAGDWPVRATASVGVARFRPGDAADDVLEQADKALYRAKEAGRNRSAIAA